MEDWKQVTRWGLIGDIKTRVAEARKTATIYPEANDILKCLKLTRYEDVKVVIVGQDPYHDGSADGLAFSSKSDKVPPSLQNIFKEIANEFGIPMIGFSWEDYFPTPNLELWAQRGILLLNTTLSVEAGKPESHKDFGWQDFTKSIIEAVNLLDKSVVFMLWGNHARAYKSLITNHKHLVLESVHPSPLAGGKFFGNNHFIQATQFLARAGRLNTYSFKQFIDFPAIKNDIQKKRVELKWTDKFARELYQEIESCAFYSLLQDSLHLFSTNPQINKNSYE